MPHSHPQQGRIQAQVYTRMLPSKQVDTTLERAVRKALSKATGCLCYRNSLLSPQGSPARVGGHFLTRCAFLSGTLTKPSPGVPREAGRLHTPSHFPLRLPAGWLQDNLKPSRWQ